MTDEASLQVAQEALKRWTPMPPVRITIGRWEAYVLVGLLQLVTRHVDGTPQKIGTAIGRQIQEAIADGPEIYALMELGWDPAHDVERKGPQ